MDQVDGKGFSRLVGQCTGRGEEQGDWSNENNNNNNNNNNSSMAQAIVPTRTEYYKMNHPRRGLALIFNHQHFQNKQRDREREATDQDAIKLKKCFQDLRFEPQIYKDLTLKEIQTQIDHAVNADHSNADCILVAVLTHGDENRLHAFDKSYDPQKELYDKFKPDKCPTLTGKPKIFVLQACQGKRTDVGIHLKTEFDGLNKGYRIPLAADFLFVYATVPGFYAFRNTVAGSYFISVLCEQLNSLAQKDHLTDILTTVNNRVAVEFVSNNRDREYHDKKQMPYFVNALTKKVHFNYPHVNAAVEEKFFIRN